MIELYECGVEIFGTKHRVIVENVQHTKPLLFGIGTQAGAHACKVADLVAQRWVKHRYLEEDMPLRMKVEEWMEFMTLQPISLDTFYDRTLRIHHVNLKGH